MAYIDLDLEGIADGVVYVSAAELRALTGVPRSTLHHHIVTNKIDAYRFRNRTYFLPEAANQYVRLFNARLLG